MVGALSRQHARPGSPALTLFGRSKSKFWTRQTALKHRFWLVGVIRSSVIRCSCASLADNRTIRDVVVGPT